MAAAILEEHDDEVVPPSKIENEDLIHCGICHNLLEDPRTLSCLHTFCLKCLVEKESNKALSCPTCSTVTKLPDNGVSGMDAIAFIVRQRNEMKIRDEIANQCSEVECTACEEGSLSTMRCFECDDYLCETCVKSHKRNRHQKQHLLLTLEELLSNKGIQTLPDFNICSKHKGETLMFYCNTCYVPICSKCAVVAHIHPEHKRAELTEITTEERKKRMKELEIESDKVALKIDGLISETNELERKVKASSATVLSELDDIKESVKSQFLDNLERIYQESKAAIQYSEKQINEKTAELKRYRSRLATSKKIFEELIERGSEFEIASVYANVMKSFKELCEVNTSLPKSLSDETYVYFADKTMVHDSSVGEICKVFRGMTDKYDMYDLVKHNQFGQLKNGRGISFVDNQKIVVSDHDQTEYFSYDLHGVQKSKSSSSNGTDSGWKSYPWSIVVSSVNGRYFGTDGTQYVKWYYSGDPANYGGRYNVPTPNGSTTQYEGSKVQGLALDKSGNLIVGNVTNKSVSIMTTGGTQITSMNVSIQPWFISATPTDNIIVSSYSDHAVHVIDRTGKVTLTLYPPDDISNGSWNPSGVCCTGEGTIFVANYTRKAGIFQYRLSDGAFMRCCTKDVTEPWGIALSQDETNLAVADGTCVKVFDINLCQARVF